MAIKLKAAALAIYADAITYMKKPIQLLYLDV